MKFHYSSSYEHSYTSTAVGDGGKSIPRFLQDGSPVVNSSVKSQPLAWRFPQNNTSYCTYILVYRSDFNSNRNRKSKIETMMCLVRSIYECTGAAVYHRVCVWYSYQVIPTDSPSISSKMRVSHEFPEFSSCAKNRGRSYFGKMLAVTFLLGKVVKARRPRHMTCT